MAARGSGEFRVQVRNPEARARRGREAAGHIDDSGPGALGGTSVRGGEGGRAGEKYEAGAFETGFVNRLHVDGFSGNFSKGASSQFFIERADFAHREPALVDPLPQVFAAKRRGSADGYAQ